MRSDANPVYSEKYKTTGSANYTLIICNKNNTQDSHSEAKKYVLCTILKSDELKT